MKEVNKYITYILLVIFTMLTTTFLHAQEEEMQNKPFRSNDTLLVAGIILGGDTLPFRYLTVVDFYGSLDPQQAAELRRLRYNVIKVYPYALTAAEILQKVDDDLRGIDKRRDQRRYIRETEKALNAQFKDELKNLTVTQGQILVKLINRETGRETYDIIKQLKGGFNARIYQTTAMFFSNNLKKNYDPYGEDSMIEFIVQEIEDHFKGRRRNVAYPSGK